jgi:hypothetical protein
MQRKARDDAAAGQVEGYHTTALALPFISAILSSRTVDSTYPEF